MSSAGQVIGGAIGAAIGTAFGSPMLGAQLGMTLGGALDPGKGPTTYGPRLSDLTVQSATYGAFIPRDYGQVGHNGNLFWLEGNKIKETEVKKKSGGKGGPKATNVTYLNTATFAVGLAKGPIGGVRRIWLRGELFYDAGSNDRDTIIASNAASIGFRLYLGTDTQMPDPRIQADLEVANTPAWRGRAYIVFYDLDLANYGGSLAGTQVKVELFKDGTYGDVKSSVVAPNNYWVSCKWDGERWYGIAQGGYLGWGYLGDVFYSYDGVNFTTPTGLDNVSGSGFWVDLVYTGSVYLALGGWGPDGGAKIARSYDLDNWTVQAMPGGSGQYWQQLIVNGATALCLSSNGFSASTTDGISFTTGTCPTTVRAEGRGCHNGTVYCTTAQTGATPAAIYISPTGLDSWSTVYPPDPFTNLYGTCVGPAGRIVVLGRRVSDGKYSITYSDDNGATWSASQIITTKDVTFYNIEYTADIGLYVAATFNSSGGAFGVPGPWFTSPDLITWTDHGALPGGSLLYDRPAWDGVQWGLIRNQANEPSDFQKFRPNALLSTSGTTLGAIVSAECISSGLLTAGDIDVTSLTPTVRGYSVSTIGTIRSALEPLQSAWPFDVVQSGYKIKFKLRGSAALAYISAADLDARDNGAAPGVQITTSREMDTQLPARVTVKYLDKDREYEIGEQYDERLNTDAVSHVIHDLAIVMTSGEGAGKAQVLLYQAWLDRYDIAFSLPASYNQLEPGDTATLQTPEGNIEVRLVVINYTSDGRLECTAKLSKAAIYTPTIVGSSPVVAGKTTIAGIGPSKFTLLDVPMVHPIQSDPTLLVNMYGTSSGWPGGLLVRTDDNGTTWIDVQGFSAPGGATGTATNAIGSADSRGWDKASVLNITMRNGDLYSATELAVLNGSNYFAYGAHGRWEIIGVQNCTLVGTNQYVLTDMLRGRFGTEWAMSTHLAGDNIFALSASDVTAIGMSTSSIGLSRTYRAITVGQTIDTGVDTPFTYAGVNLECLSPVYFIGDRVTNSTDWGLSWIRRSRTDGAWRDLVDVGLGEVSEAYQLDIFADAGFTSLKRTITSSAPACTYTSAQQVADFGVAQTNVYAKVYQMSATVGRGYPASGSFVSSDGDPYFSSVVFLPPMTGANGGTIFSDAKGKTVTAFGDAKTSTAQYVGTIGSSALFDGAGDYLTASSSADFNIGTADFCVECWTYIVGNSAPDGGGYRGALLCSIDNGSLSSLEFAIKGSAATTGVGLHFGYDPGTGWSSVSTTSAISQGAWHHIAVSRSGGYVRFFIDGTQAGSPQLFAGALGSASSSMKVGGRVLGVHPMYLNGHVGPMRITKGAARYTSAFTPAAAPFLTY